MGRKGGRIIRNGIENAVGYCEISLSQLGIMVMLYGIFKVLILIVSLVV